LKQTKNIGLRGISVADTKITMIDGIEGRLEYRGYDIKDLAKSSSYEEVAYLLLFEDLPRRGDIVEFTERLISEREIPDAVHNHLMNRPRSAQPMDVLQSTVPMLADFDPDLLEETREANIRMGIRLISKTATIVAAWSRIRRGLSPQKPSRDLPHAANLLYMLHGREPDGETARDLDVCFVLHADHSFNASTFAARQVASTRAHMYAAITAAIGALSGELHGGANTKVMKTLLEIGEVEKVRGWVNRQLEQGRRIMGMGHAVYKTTDPRAIILKDMSERIGRRLGQTKWYEMTRLIEEETRGQILKSKRKEIYPNVDLYSASVYYMMGIDVDLYTAVFALARMAGWVSHIIEEKFAEAQPKPVMYRPEADYIGRYCGVLGCRYIPIEQR